VVLEGAGGLGSWHANLVRFNRVQCVLFCHDETRYCLFLPGIRARQLAELGRWHSEVFRASLAMEGIADSTIARSMRRWGRRDSTRRPTGRCLRR
jgi:hypothetical protein